MVVPFFRSHLTRLTRDARYHRQKEESEAKRRKYPTMRIYPMSNNESVGIWKGWNAALIVSKQKGLPVFARDGSIEEAQAKERKRNIEPSSVKLSLTSKVGPRKNCHRKRKRVEMLNFQQQDSAANKTNDLALAHPTASSFDGMREEDIKILMEGVDALSMHVLVELKYVRLLREFLGDDSYRRIVESLFRSVAKFVLSVFDQATEGDFFLVDGLVSHPDVTLEELDRIEQLNFVLTQLHQKWHTIFVWQDGPLVQAMWGEDFERIHHHNEIFTECQSFCSMFPDKIGVATKEEVFAKAVDTVIKESHRFPAMTDHDFCYILGEYAQRIDWFEKLTGIDRSITRGFVGNPFEFELSAVAEDDTDNIARSWGSSMLIKKGRLQEDDISKSFRNNVIEDVMQSFVPLKDYCKTQLGLELMRGNGYLVFDTLLIEVLKDVKIDSLFEIPHKVPTLTERMSVGRDFSDGREVVYVIIVNFVKALLELGWFKATTLAHSQKSLAYCLSIAFGPCKAEVIEVIKIADHERRLNNKPSISLENINYGLSLSRVGESVKEIPTGSPQKFSIIEFFKLSRQKANKMGHKKVGLKHLILAMNTVLRKDLMENAPLVPDDGVAEDLECLKKIIMNEHRSVRRWIELSPMYGILRSRYRIFCSSTADGAGSPVRCVKRVRKCRVDVSWIRKDRRTPSSE